MSCPKTQHLIIEYFAENLQPQLREKFDRHIQDCEVCSSELAKLLDTQGRLLRWRDEPVPHWDRGASLFRSEQGNYQKPQRVGKWQWMPTAFSFAMLLILVFNLTIVSSDEGLTLTFGGEGSSIISSQLEPRLAEFTSINQQERDQVLQSFWSILSERQDRNNLILMRTVLDQTREMTAENFDRMYSYFEQQRQLDIENVQVSYQQLVDSDFDTLQSVQQLANYIRFQGQLR